MLNVRSPDVGNVRRDFAMNTGSPSCQLHIDRIPDRFLDGIITNRGNFTARSVDESDEKRTLDEGQYRPWPLDAIDLLSRIAYLLYVYGVPSRFFDTFVSYVVNNFALVDNLSSTNINKLSFDYDPIEYASIYQTVHLHFIDYLQTSSQSSQTAISVLTQLFRLNNNALNAPTFCDLSCDWGVHVNSEGSNEDDEAEDEKADGANFDTDNANHLFEVYFAMYRLGTIKYIDNEEERYECVGPRRCSSIAQICECEDSENRPVRNNEENDQDTQKTEENYRVNNECEESSLDTPYFSKMTVCCRQGNIPSLMETMSEDSRTHKTTSSLTVTAEMMSSLNDETVSRGLTSVQSSCDLSCNWGVHTGTDDIEDEDDDNEPPVSADIVDEQLFNVYFALYNLNTNDTEIHETVRNEDNDYLCGNLTISNENEGNENVTIDGVTSYSEELLDNMNVMASDDKLLDKVNVALFSNDSRDEDTNF